MTGIAVKDIPENWEKVKLGEIVNIVYGKNLPTKDLKEDGYPVYGANGVIGKYDRYLYEEEQVLISCRGAYSGKANISPPFAFVTNNSLILEIPKENKLNKKYLYYWLTIADKSSLVTGSAQPQVTINNAVELFVPLAPLEQQKRIVAKIEELFSHIDAGIDALKKAKQLLKQYRQSVLKAAVTGELTKEWREANKDKLEPASKLLERMKTEKKEELERKMAERKNSASKGKKPSTPKAVDLELDLSKNVSQKNLQIPDSWIKINLDYASSKLGDGLHGTPAYSEGDCHFINGNNLYSGRILIKPETKTVSNDEAGKHLKELNSRTILVSINGTLGNIALYNGEKVILGKSACYFNLLPSLSREYVRWILESNEFQSYAIKTATGSTIKNIPLKAMREFIFPLCHADEQDEIVRLIEEKLNAIEHLSNEIDQQLIKSEKNKQSILASAFSGRI